MKNRYALIIVFSSALGIIFTLTNTVFIVENSNHIVSGLELFKYFTIQSNLLVVTYFSMYLFTNLKENKVFKKMLGGIVIYISITSLVFFKLLEPIYSPKGIALFGSLLNHYLTPMLVLGFVYKFRSNYDFILIDIEKWIIYPISYLTFLTVYGLITDDYIYPFFQASEVGVIGIILSVVGIVLLFLLMSFTLVKIVSKK